VIPRDEMVTFASQIDVPKTAMARIFGPFGASLLPLMICVSVFGAANPNLLATPRCFYAMAKDGVVFAPLMRVHAKFQTPHVAIWSQAIWAALLVVVLKTFRDITDYVVFASLLFYGLTAAGVIVLRRKRPDAPPFRCPLVPIVPLVFVAVVLAVDGLTLASEDNRRNALIGLMILAAGCRSLRDASREAERGAMKTVIGGSGQIRTFLARALVEQGHEVVVLAARRQPDGAAPAAWRAVTWDGATLGEWARELDGADVLVNLAGRSVGTATVLRTALRWSTRASARRAWSARRSHAPHGRRASGCRRAPRRSTATATTRRTTRRPGSSAAASPARRRSGTSASRSRRRGSARSPRPRRRARARSRCAPR
jgi:hypothetical protein